MALKRLDEEFDLKPGTQLLPYMKRLLPSLEGRFQNLEAERKTIDQAIGEMRAVALQRINEILIPATEAITEVTQLGFLLGPSTSSVYLEIGVKQFIIIEGPQRETFTPSPYVIVERSANIDDYAIARVQYYTRETGELSLYITAVHGNPGPWNDWVISSTPGMADSTKLYHDAVGPMHDQVAADRDEVEIYRDEIIAAAQALEAAGLDAQNFVRRDGAVPFIATQRGVAPASGANDNTLVTAAWSRARSLEYAGQAMQRTGDTMTGFLTLHAQPVNPFHAATKAYVDAIIGAGGTMNNSLTIHTTSPAVRLRATGTGQNRTIEALGLNGAYRWVLSVADAGAESGGNAGSNFALYRYNDGGAYLGQAFYVLRASGDAGFSGTLAVGGNLNVAAGGANINGNIANAGDFWTYRADNTGVVWMGNARSARIYWNGSTWDFNAGGISCGGSPLTGGHLNCYSIYTQGYGITTWGLTSHGAAQINGAFTVNANVGNQLTLTGAGHNQIMLYDTDWGAMYLHHNGDLIGFLNNGAGWIHYITNAGHMWTAQYGWLHDYVNGTANNYAWAAANSRWNDAVNSFATHGTANHLQNQLNQHWGRMDGMQNQINGVWGAITSTRLAHAGDPSSMEGGLQVYEPFGGSVVTGWGGYNNIIWYFRCRYLQVAINGNWYTTGYV